MYDVHLYRSIQLKHIYSYMYYIHGIIGDEYVLQYLFVDLVVYTV